MKPIFEYNDTLNNPYEAFLFNSQTNPFQSHRIGIILLRLSIY